MACVEERVSLARQERPLALPLRGRIAESDWHISGEPYLEYVVFQLLSEGWKRVALEALPVEAKPTFLASTRAFFEDNPPLRSVAPIDLLAKRKPDARSTLSIERREILRR
jgi:hypothetical protein